jgi:ribosomal protein L7/L12
MTEKTYTMYSVAQNFWRFGNDLEEVIQYMEDEMGREDMAEFGFAVVEFARPVTLDEVDVNDVNGYISYPGDAGAHDVISQEDSRDYLKRRIARDKFTVTLTDFGNNKITAVKMVRAVTGLGLKDAKAIVDSVPAVIEDGLSKEEADLSKAWFGEDGITVVIS